MGRGGLNLASVWLDVSMCVSADYASLTRDVVEILVPLDAQAM